MEKSQVMHLFTSEAPVSFISW